MYYIMCVHLVVSGYEVVHIRAGCRVRFGRTFLYTHTTTMYIFKKYTSIVLFFHNYTYSMYICIYLYVFIPIQMRICRYICATVYIYIYMYMSVYMIHGIYIYIYIYMHLHILGCSLTCISCVT